MTLYVNTYKEAIVVGKDAILVEDVCNIVGNKKITDKLLKKPVMKINDKEPKNYLVDVMDLVQVIISEYGNVDIELLGATETLVKYVDKEKRNSLPIMYLKICFVALIMFAGSATAIMAFNQETLIPRVFQNYNRFFFGEEYAMSKVMETSYSIGIAVGIIVFFNHFGGKKITSDPTPIQIEMTEYETSVTDTIIDSLKVEEKKKDV